MNKCCFSAAANKKKCLGPSYGTARFWWSVTFQLVSRPGSGGGVRRQRSLEACLVHHSRGIIVCALHARHGLLLAPNATPA